MQESFGKKQQSLIFIVEKALKKSNLGYLSMKEGSLFVFCTYEIQRTGMLQIVFLVCLESSQGGGVHRLGFMALGLAV